MAEIDRLTTVFDANTSRLEAAVKRIEKVNSSAAAGMERRWKSANDNLGKSFGGGELNRGLDALASRGGAATAGLSALGGAGLAAAAGVGAFVAALAGARQAATFADDIADTAKRLHVSTDALQEYRYAVRLAGGDIAGADKALEAFSVNLGKAQQGLSKSERGFKALGFTEAQINGFRDAGDALDQVVERISGLSDVQQDAIIQQLGLDGIKPLIAAGADEMRRLKQEAHEVGLVMDAGLIERGAELNDQFETVTQVIDLQMKQALVDLGPVLLYLLGLVSDMAKFAADVADNFRAIENKRTTTLQERRDDLQGKLNDQVAPGVYMLGGLARENAVRELRQVNAELQQRMFASNPSTQFGFASASTYLQNQIRRGGSSRELIDTSGGGGAGRSRAPVNTLTQIDPLEAIDLRRVQRTFAEEMLDIHPTQLTQTAEEIAAVVGEAVANSAETEKGLADLRAKNKEAWEESTQEGLERGLTALANGDFLDVLGQALQRELISALAKGLTSYADESGGWAGTAIKSFAGMFAAGGTIPGGKWGIAGEAGPEIISGPATVTPINARALQANGVRAGGGVVQQIRFDLRGAVMTADLLAQMERLARRSAQVASVQTLQAARKGSPGQQSRLQLLGTP